MSVFLFYFLNFIFQVHILYYLRSDSIFLLNKKYLFLPECSFFRVSYLCVGMLYHFYFSQKILTIDFFAFYQCPCVSSEFYFLFDYYDLSLSWQGFSTDTWWSLAVLQHWRNKLQKANWKLCVHDRFYYRMIWQSAKEPSGLLPGAQLYTFVV